MKTTFYKIGVKLFLWLILAPAIYGQMSFKDVTEESGINHQFKVFEGMFGGGICVFDLNKDGFEDLFITSGMNDDCLYLNHGDGTFTNVYEGSGLEITRHYVTQGAAGADVNRDGWVDLFITTITSKDSVKAIPREKNLLFLNNGDNTFSDATAQYRLDNLYSFSTGASFGDFNADGFPDLYVGNYFLEHDGPLSEINDATIVNASRRAKDYLLLNVNGKYFRNVYEDYGLSHEGFGFGAVFTDFDNDGDQDLFVNNDFGYKAKPNYLLRNEYPKKKFSYVEEEFGMDLRINAMASAVGDYDNNGFMDYFVTNIKFNNFMVAGDPPTIQYKDRARELGMSIFTISWGANWADFDHDKDLDLYVANGDLNPNCTPMGNFLFVNDGVGFSDQSLALEVKDYGIGRGSVIFDLENDGDMDILFVNQEPLKEYPVESFSRLYRNDNASGNWLQISLVGTLSDPLGIGSRIRVVADDVSMIREVDGGSSSHISQNSTIAHFGLGESEMVDSVIVSWSGKEEQVLTNIQSNQRISIVQEEKLRSRKPTYVAFMSFGFLLLVIAMIRIFRKT
jgi:hypothetical protein